MVENIAVSLLKLFQSGSVKISENGRTSLEFIAHGNQKQINIYNLPADIQGTQTFFQKLSQAKRFAKSLKENKMTITIYDHNNEVLKIGQDAKPKLSRLFTSSDVQIVDLRNLRQLDRRLRS